MFVNSQTGGRPLRDADRFQNLVESGLDPTDAGRVIMDVDDATQVANG